MRVFRGSAREQRPVIGVKLSSASAQELLDALRTPGSGGARFVLHDDGGRHATLQAVSAGGPSLTLRLEQSGEGGARHECFAGEMAPPQPPRRKPQLQLRCVGPIVARGFVEQELSSADRHKVASSTTVAESARRQRHSVLLEPVAAAAVAGKPATLRKTTTALLQPPQLRKAATAPKPSQMQRRSNSAPKPPSPVPPPPTEAAAAAAAVPPVGLLLGPPVQSRAEYAALAKTFRALHARHGSLLDELRAAQAEFAALSRDINGTAGNAAEVALRRERAAARIRSLHAERLGPLRAARDEIHALAPALRVAKDRLVTYASSFG